MAAAVYLLRTEEYNKVTENQAYIRENMDYEFMMGALTKFYSEQLVTAVQYQDFMETRLNSERANTLFELLLSGTSYRYESFCDFCEEEHPDMYERLKITEYEAVTVHSSEDLPPEGECLARPKTADVVTRCSSPPACLMNLDTESSARMDGGVIPVVSAKIRQKLSKHKSVYQMSFPARGVALLFFNVEFSDNNFPRRLGAQHDLDNLSRLFHDLNYNVKVVRNADRATTLDELEFQRRNQAHSGYGSFVLGFSTHGGNVSKTIACADGKTIYIHEIYDLFDSTHCPLLAGKPKFIFFDASSGGARDKGVPLDKELEAPKRFEPVKKQLSDIRFTLGNLQIGSKSVQRVPADQIMPLDVYTPPITNCVIPNKTDFIVAMSTFEGYVSWRRNSHGCWFSRILVEVFQKHACDTHLLELLRLVRKKMSYVETKTGYKQVTMTMDTSMKHFYFFPGINP